MIWKRLRKSTKKDERELQERFTEAGVTWSDKFAMIVSAYLVLFLPAALFLIGLVLLVMWMFGII